MKLTDYSRNLLLSTFSKWGVDKDFADPMYNYLVNGYSPGSCFTAVLANDFSRAVACSHPSNTITAFKALAGWISDCAPREAHGSYEAINHWCYLPAEARRQILEEYGLVYTEEKEVWMILEGKSTTEPVLY